jgi:hypothetical protein
VSGSIGPLFRENLLTVQAVPRSKWVHTGTLLLSTLIFPQKQRRTGASRGAARSSTDRCGYTAPWVNADASVSPPSDPNGGECDQRRSELRRHPLTRRRDLGSQIAKFERAWPAGPTSEHPTWKGNDTLVTLLIGQNDIVRVARPSLLVPR